MINLTWDIPYYILRDLRFLIPNEICISFSEDRFCVLANSIDPDEMPDNVAFHLGLHYLQKYGVKSH